ncbi:helix-turn-helix domain-containing protein [Rhodococcus aetherivorans]|uniref:helix-turn-helix domain-containing protein n=1 Tax=Rhodococcus aetherivorans TaxID=191292 RepID=UPI00367B98CE
MSRRPRNRPQRPVAEEFRVERLRRHLTHGALAKASGVSHHTILRLERGEGITDMVDLVWIGLVLEVQATDLLRRALAEARLAGYFPAEAE